MPMVYSVLDHEAALPHLQPGASIINTATSNVYDPREKLLDHVAAKAAIVKFSKGLAKQLGSKTSG